MRTWAAFLGYDCYNYNNRYFNQAARPELAGRAAAQMHLFQLPGPGIKFALRPGMGR